MKYRGAPPSKLQKNIICLDRLAKLSLAYDYDYEMIVGLSHSTVCLTMRLIS